MKPHGILLALMGAVALCCAVGCATPAFNREWNSLTSQSSPTNAITGRWEGYWTSPVNMHRGDLRCIVSQLSETEYRFFYRANFWIFFQGSYSLNQTVRREGEVFKLSGQADLGLFGTFVTEGEATPNAISSTYRSGSEHGVFKLVRPER